MGRRFVEVDSRRTANLKLIFSYRPRFSLSSIFLFLPLFSFSPVVSFRFRRPPVSRSFSRRTSEIRSCAWTPLARRIKNFIWCAGNGRDDRSYSYINKETADGAGLLWTIAGKPELFFFFWSFLFFAFSFGRGEGKNKSWTILIFSKR